MTDNHDPAYCQAEPCPDRDAYQLARDLELNQKTAWYMSMRIRGTLADVSTMLQAIVEAGEANIGGKLRKLSLRDDDAYRPAKRCHGTTRMHVLGAVERGGNVVAEPSLKVTAAALRGCLKSPFVTLSKGEGSGGGG